MYAVSFDRVRFFDRMERKSILDFFEIIRTYATTRM